MKIRRRTTDGEDNKQQQQPVVVPDTGPDSSANKHSAWQGSQRLH